MQVILGMALVHHCREMGNVNMGANQIATIERNLNEICKDSHDGNEPPLACCTFETTSAQGAPVWIQAMPGTVNMSYGLSADPTELLRNQGVRGPADLYIVDWEAGEYATFGFEGVSTRDQAFFVDQLFVKVLGCDDETYQLTAKTESLDE